MMELDPSINNTIIAILGGITRVLVFAPIYILLEVGRRPKAWLLPVITVVGLLVVILLSILMSPLHFTWLWFLGGAIVMDLVYGVLAPFSGSVLFWIAISPFLGIYYGVMWYMRLKSRHNH